MHATSTHRVCLLALIVLLLSGAVIPANATPPTAEAAQSTQQRTFLPFVSRSAPSSSAQESIRAALEAGSINYETSLLYRAYALFGDARLPAHLWGTGSDGEDAELFDEAVRPELSSTLKAQLRPFLVRPNHPDSIYNQAAVSPRAQGVTTAAVCDASWTWISKRSTSANVRVWAQCTRAGDTETFAILDTVIALVDAMWTPMVSFMGAPLPDEGGEGFGGDTAIDIYVVAAGVTVHRDDKSAIISSEAVAVAATSEPYIGVSSSGFMLLGRARLAGSSFYTDLVHEFFHVLQYAHNQEVRVRCASSCRGPDLEKFWFVEASATWAETQFARITSAQETHWRFTQDFQGSTAPLIASSPKEHMYAAYIWPFFVEQERGAAAIATIWDDLAKMNDGDWDKANDAIERQVPFNTNFHTFALRNLNAELEEGEELVRRYSQLDQNFPEGPHTMPPMRADARLSVLPDRNNPYTFTTGIPALTARYYHFTIEDDDPEMPLGQVVFDFSQLTQQGLDVDAVVRAGGEPWSVRHLTGQSSVRFCFDKPEEQLQELYLVVSNHSRQLDHQINGQIRVSPLKDPCSCEHVARVPAWEGSVTSSYSVSGSTDIESVSTRQTAQLSGRLEEFSRGPGGVTYIGAMTGTASLNYVHSIGGEVVDRLDGSGPIVPYDQDNHDLTSVIALYIGFEECTYAFTFGPVIMATTLQGNQVATGVGDVGREHVKVPQNSLIFNGSSQFAAHSESYIFDHGGDYYHPGYDVSRVVGEDNLGTALVTWSFKPVDPPTQP